MTTYVRWNGTKKWHKLGDDNKTVCGVTVIGRKTIEVSVDKPDRVCVNCQKGD